MDVRIQDNEALAAISPTALAAYARAAGWVRTEPYGAHADVYQAEEQPEIILPRTQRVGDYALVVSRLIGIFAAAAGMNELALYRELTMADRDVVRIAAETGDESVPIDDGVTLVVGVRNLLLAAASSLRRPKPYYRADRDAAAQLRRMRFGLPERGSFVVTVQTPSIPQPMQTLADDEDGGVPERRTTRRLVEAIDATKFATEGMVYGDDSHFWRAVASGSSANLCEALAAMIEPFPTLDVSFSWAKTREPPRFPRVIHFANDDVPILRQAAQSLRHERGKDQHIGR